MLTLHDALTEEITALDGDVKKAAKGNPVVKQLSSLPGVGLFGALLPCMDLDLEQRSQAVLHLPVATRAELASRLLDSLDSAETTESAESVAAAWDAELDRREADFGAAAGFGIPASEVFQRLDADLAALATHHETHR